MIILWIYNCFPKLINRIYSVQNVNKKIIYTYIYSFSLLFQRRKMQYILLKL